MLLNDFGAILGQRSPGHYFQLQFLQSEWCGLPEKSVKITAKDLQPVFAPSHTCTDTHSPVPEALIRTGRITKI